MASYQGLAAAALLFAAGAAARGPAAAVISRWAALALVWFSMPVLTLYTVAANVPGDPLFTRVALASTVATVPPLAVLRLVYGRLCPCPLAAATALSSTVANVVFLPAPLALSLGLPLEPVIAYSIGYTVAVSLLVPFAGCRRGGVRLAATYPPLYALLAAAAAVALGEGQRLAQLLEPLRGPAAWLTLLSFFLVGESVARLWPPRLTRCTAAVAAWRLGVSPLLHWAVLIPALGITGAAYKVTMMEAVMPPATMNLVFSRLYRLDEQTVTSSIALLTPVSIIAALAAALG